MNTKHTPGPWHIENGNDSRVYLVNNGKGHAIGELVYFDARKKVDARLIAAAPDLLACLIDAVRALEFAAPIIEAPEKCSYRETIAEAHAAIAKATGGAE